MIRLILTSPTKESQVLTFTKEAVTIGRSPSNDICLADLRVSKNHGRIANTEHGFVYEDLWSTNGSRVHRGSEHFQLSSNTAKLKHTLEVGDELELASFRLRLDVDEPVLASRIKSDLTVMMKRQALQPAHLNTDGSSLDVLSTARFLQLVRETTLAKHDESQLGDAIARVVFETFNCATHFAMLVRDIRTGRLRPFLSCQRDGREFEAVLSRTIVGQVMHEGTSLLFTGSEESAVLAESVVRARIETAICAPLMGSDRPFGVAQIDIRFPGKGVFTSRDLDLMTLFTGYLGLVLENLRLLQDQQHSLESTINALVHSLWLKDPETAHHSERVRKVSLRIGEELRLNEHEMEILSVAAILHDTGKQGVRDEVLFKPGRLTEEEGHEVDQHAEYTQTILDKISYPEHLRSVPLIAAYHHERINGRGIYGIPGDQIPIQSRIIAVSDAVDALASKRCYKDAIPLPKVLDILEEGRNEDWDGHVLDALHRVANELAQELYPNEAPQESASEFLNPEKPQIEK